MAYYERVLGKALPGVRARRRAVEANRYCGVPVAIRIAPSRDRQSASKFTRDGLARLGPPDVHPGTGPSEMEVIRDQF
jgi:hypothetical protein